MTSTTLRKVLVATAAIAALSVAACGKKAADNNTANATDNNAAAANTTTNTTDNAMAANATANNTTNATAPAANNTTEKK